MSNLHRTEEWHRLKNSGFIAITDEPGLIVATMEPPGKKMIRKLRIGFFALAASGLLLGIGGSLVAAVIGVILTSVLACLTFGLMILSAHKRMGKFADRVVFTPTELCFYLGSNLRGRLPRAGMQQIVADIDGYRLRYHRFVADMGYYSAFPSVDETDHLIVNNVLMAAFRQPLHLDGALAASEPVHTMTLDQRPPQVEGLRAISE